MITIYNQQKDLKISLKSIKKAIPSLLKKLHIQTDEVILHFVTKTKIAKIHQDHFDDPSPTDCMSFPIDSPDTYKEDSFHLLGEIFICPKVAIEYAEKYNLDPYEETTLYIIHGLLHLIGYDDLNEVDRKKMRAMEKKCLKLLAPFSLSTQKKVLP